MEMKDLKVLIAGEHEEFNAAAKRAVDRYGVQCDVAGIEDAEEMIFTGDYTHIIVTLVEGDDREKGMLYYNLLKIRLPAWQKGAKLFKAGISDFDDNDYIRELHAVMDDIAAKIIIN